MKHSSAILIFLVALTFIQTSLARDVLTVSGCGHCAYGYKCVNRKQKFCPGPSCFPTNAYKCVEDPHAPKQICKVEHKCHDVQDKKCDTVTKKVCDKDVIKKECKQVPFTVCKQVPKQVCTIEKKKICKKEPKQICKFVDKKVCDNVPFTDCKDVKVCVNKQSCNSIPKKVCKKVCAHFGKSFHGKTGACLGFKDVCKTEHVRQCRDVPVCKIEKKCVTINKVVCKNVPQKICDTIFEDKCHFIDDKVCKTISEKVCKTEFKTECHDITIPGLCKFIDTVICKPFTRKECKDVKVCHPAPPVKCPDHTICNAGYKCEVIKKCITPQCTFKDKFECVRH